MFDLENPLLAETIGAADTPTPTRFLCVVEDGVTRHRPGLLLAIEAYARRHRAVVELAEPPIVVPGGEPPLVAGIADAMGAEGIACCGPSAAAARLEGSKSFTKELCDAAGIPTALWERFDDAASARAFVRRRGAPIVVKADGLAAGKGVVVAASVAEAVTTMMSGPVFLLVCGTAEVIMIQFGRTRLPVVPLPVDECSRICDSQIFVLSIDRQRTAPAHSQNSVARA